MIALIKSAAPIDAPLQMRLQQALEQALGQPVTLEIALQPDLLCGLIVQAGGRIWDFSARENLQALRRLLSA